jgi:cytochrome b561
MQPISSSASSYDRTTIWFHWLTAFLVVAQWVGAETSDFWPKGPLRVDAISMHITFGVVLGLVVLARLVWRLTGGRRLPDAQKGILALAVQAMHWGFYLLILTVVGLGLSLVLLRSMSYFNLFMLPTVTDAARATFRSLHSNHELLAHAVMIALLLHAGAALVHHTVLRDGVLKRMIPGLR